MMKRPDRKQFRQLHLQPVQPVVTRPLPDVPEHFNYGVFYDDDFDYMQYLKPASEGNGQTLYRITSIPEDDTPFQPDVPVEQVREPTVDDEPVPEGLGLASDEEFEEYSDIEDNFVELAGGAKTDEGCLESKNDGVAKVCQPKDRLRKEKVLMMERFLFGENEVDEDDNIGDMFSDCESNDPDGSSAMNSEFEKLVLRCKNRSRLTCGSVVSDTSIVSEGLKYALNQDSRILSRRCSKSSDLDGLEDDVKLKTLNNGLTIDQTDSSSSSESDDQTFASIMSTEECSRSQKLHLDYLKMPRKPKARSRDNVPQPNNDVTPSPECPPIAPCLLVRKKDESADEKRLRKLLIKQHRADRRKVRKMNQCNFRVEHSKHAQLEPRVVGIH